MQVLRNTMYKMSLCTWILTFFLVFPQCPHSLCSFRKSKSYSYSIIGATVQSNVRKTMQCAMRSKRRLPVLLHPGHSSFNLLICHKHHNVPGPQTQKRRHEPNRGQKKDKLKVTQTCYFIAVWIVLRKCVLTLYRRRWVLHALACWEHSW